MTKIKGKAKSHDFFFIGGVVDLIRRIINRQFRMMASIRMMNSSGKKDITL
jgi:hypothetical protein